MFIQNLTSFSLILTLFFLYFQCTSSQIIDNVVSCSGFVRLSPEFSNQYKPNLSEIKIVAKSGSGIVKETVECSPHGFYLLPIYDVGSYKLEVQGPSGWSFEPNSATVSIDNGSCNDGNDINFIVTGFSIYGSVKTDEKEPRGIPGVSVQLKDASGAQLQVQTSSEDGTYVFKNVKPGNYIIQPQHSTWTLSESQIDIQVPCGNLDVEKDIVVKGYDLFGIVLSEGGEPMMGVDFLLYRNGKVEKKLSSGQDGKFHFFEVPCGNYELIASYLSDTTTFEVSPRLIPVKICRQSVSIPNPFRIVGFSVNGKVLNSGQGIEGVAIIVNGNEKTTTNNNGVYKWEKAQEGVYSISAVKEHYQFSSIENTHISPSNYHLPEIQAEKYHICGKLHVESSFPNYLKVREVNIKNSETSQISTIKTSPEGDFCIFVGSGEYSVSPVQAEESKGLLFTPNEKLVKITNSPVLNQDFYQSKVSLTGSIQPAIDFPVGNIEVKLVDLNTKQVKQITKVDKNSIFQFTDVFPGNYQLDVDYNKFCWKSNSIPVSVKTEDVKDLHFERIGHKFAFSLNAEVDLVFENAGSLNKRYTKGKHDICIPNSAEEYSIVPTSCLKFENEKYVFNIKNNAYPEPLKISYTHYQVSGSIFTSQADSSLSISIQTNQNVQKPAVVPVSSENKVHYQYTFWALPGESLSITPSSENLLFYPKSHKVSIHTQDKCVEKLPDFEGRAGKYFQGSIEPPMSGVHVTIYSKTTREVITTVNSNESGKYIAGPLYDDIQYDLSASLEGYNFVRSGDNFEAIELAKLTISIVDTDGSPINGAVLLSLTSDDGFRRNNATDSTGQFTFEDLFPKNYYLKPLLKEYNFNPSNLEIEVTAGATIKKVITAIRVAYSCFGSVKTLNSIPERGLTVQAKSVDGNEVEETQSDENGNFRIRGLKPAKEYQIYVKSGGKVDRSSPPQYQFLVPMDDTRDVNFVIFKKSNRYELTGVVNTNNPEWISTLHVQLFAQKDDTPIRAIKLGPSNVFNFPLLPKDDYYIRLNTTLSSKLYNYKLEDIPVAFDNDVAYKEIKFEADFHVYDAEIAHTPFYYLILIVLAILLYIYKHPVNQLIQKFKSGKWSEEDGVNHTPKPKKK